MPGIDDKVVSMSFDNSKFESGVNKTISTLDRLKAALHFPGGTKGLADLSAATKSVDMGHISKGIEGVKDSLNSLRLLAIGVLSQLATSAIRAGTAFIKSFTLDPIKAGFAEYSTNLNAIQTILANTQAAGTKLEDVNKALKELNEYSDKTIYNFSQMAKNIGTFTAAGVELDTAVASIKGIANLAALSGSNADQASTAMYQLSQAIAAGSVKLQDWNSVVNAGMGGTVFQRALATTAEALGTLKKGSVELVGPMKNVTIEGEAFRQSLSTPGKASWLTSDVLTKTLKQFTGDLKDAELAAMGFNKAQIKAIQQTALTAMHAATEVKTIAQVFQVAKETAASGWAQTFQILFGDFEEAKKTFTALSETINGFINTNADARNKVLGDWKALGGRTVLIKSIGIMFQNLGKIIAPIKEAFRDIFPATTGKDLFALTLQFRDFAKALKPSEETVEGLKRTFRGLFAILSIVGQVIGGIITVFAKLFGAVGEGTGGFLAITGAIGDFFVRLDAGLKKGDGLHKFFSGLGTILAAPVKLLSALANAMGDLFSGFSSGGVVAGMDGMTKAMTPLQKVIEGIADAWDKFITSLSGGNLDPVVGKIIDMVSGMGEAIGNAASNMNFDTVLQVIRTGLFGGLLYMLKGFFGKGSFLDQIGKGLGGGILSNISGSFRALEGSMTAMQTNIKAKTLKEIAIAIALLTASVVALSFVDPKKVSDALGAITVMLLQLLGAMAILNKIALTGGFLKLPMIAGGLILLALAIDLLVIAVFALSRLSWEELLKGLGGVAALLVGVSAAAAVLSANSGGMLRASVGIIAIAIAINLLAVAVKLLSTLSWNELAKGLVGVGGGLAVIVGAMQVMPKGMILQSAALIAIAIALNLLAVAMQKFAGMKWEGIGKGLAGIGGALVIIAGAMHIMPKGMVLQAAALLLVALALGKISAAVMSMGGMSIKEIAKGLGTLAGSLAILAAALYLMSGTLAGSAALALAAAGIAVLAPALVMLGKQSWTTIVKGLVGLGAALVILGIAGVAVAGAVPGLIGLGVAMVLIGGGLALAGAGIFLIGLALSAIAVSGPAALVILVAAFAAFIAAIIVNAKNLVLALLAIVQAFADTAPQFVAAMLKILDALVKGIIKATPKIQEAFIVLLAMVLDTIGSQAPLIIAAGLQLLMDLLNGIKNNIGRVTVAVVDIIVNFINALSGQLGKIINAGVNLLIAFLKGIANSYGLLITTVMTIITKFLSTIASNLGKFVASGYSILVKFMMGILQGLGRVAKIGVDVLLAFLGGIAEEIPRIAKAGTKVITTLIHAIGQNAVKLADEGMKAITNFMNGLADAINENAGEMQKAGGRIGLAIIDGLTFGLASKAQGLYDKATAVMNKVVGILSKIPLIGSPSRVTTEIGKALGDGLILGLDRSAPHVYASATTISKSLIQKFKDLFGIHSPSEVMIELGKLVGQGFAQGLRGSQDDIRGAFSELQGKLTEAMVTARETIISEQEKLDELRKSKEPDLKAIKAAENAIKQSEEVLRRSTEGRRVLVEVLKSEKGELIKLANEYERISTNLDIAIEKLKAKKQERADAVAGFTEQYSDLPDLISQVDDKDASGAQQLEAYMKDVEAQAGAVATFADTLAKLQDLGIDDTTYNMLLEKGTEAQAFATALLEGGKTAIDGLAILNTQLETAAKKLAVRAGKDLYDAGVAAAAGIVKGLRSKKGEIYDTMRDIAEGMISALMAALKAKSPSEEFAKVGGFAMQGLANGLIESSKIVVNAVDVAAENALAAMKKSMGKISDIVTGELNPNPVITPVLDLTQVRSQAAELGALTAVTPITAAASYGQAALISAQQNLTSEEVLAAASGGTSVKFEQNNYSPKALTEIEIYRQTKNQLSQLKSGLALS